MSYKINWTDQKRIDVCNAIETWMAKYATASYHGEGIMQDDNCQIHAPELIADLVDDIIKPEYIED